MNAISAARRARRLSLDDIARTTRLNRRYVEAIDEGRFAELPGGLYARAYIRAVARIVQLDTAELEDVLTSLAPPPDPLPVLQQAHNDKAARIGVPTDLRVYAAATADAVLLLVLNTLTVSIVSGACGVGTAKLLSIAPMPLFVLCASTWVFYFVLLGGVQGQTPGQYFCGLPPRQKIAPLRLHTILQRAVGLENLRAFLVPAAAGGEGIPPFEQPPHAHGAR